MYAEFYGLATPAFQLTPDVRFFFESTVHRRAMAYMVYGLRHTEGFIVITGEVGAGKTILVNNLLSTVKDNTFVTANIVSSQLAGDDLLHGVAAGFGITREGLAKGPLLQRINDFLLAQHRSGKRALLIVDEAQNLTFEALEELRMLSNVVVEQATALQSLLLGQPQFRATLGSPELEQLRQRITAAYHLSPLNEAETQAYIEHRLRRAEWKGDPHFTEASFLSIYRHTKGVPRRINNLCSRLLLHGSLEQLHTLTADTVDKVAKDLREEIAGVAASPTVLPAGAEKPTVSEVLRGPKLSQAPRSAGPPEEAPASPSLPGPKLRRRQTATVSARGPVFFALATLFLSLIAGAQCYILWTTGAPVRRIVGTAQSVVDTAKPTLVQNPPTIQQPLDALSLQRSDAAPDVKELTIDKHNTASIPPPTQTTPMPAGAAARAALAPIERYTGPRAVPPGAEPRPARPSPAPSPADIPVEVGVATEQQAPLSGVRSNSMQSPRLPERTAQDQGRASQETASPPISPPRTQSSTNQDLSATEIAALVARGDNFIRAGDIASARLFYERAAEAGDRPAALRLGTTFDPGFLARAGLRGITGDTGQAAFWYDRARDLGDAGAAEQPKALDQQPLTEPISPPH
jgi:general secretion pathway protein A